MPVDWLLECDHRTMYLLIGQFGVAGLMLAVTMAFISAGMLHCVTKCCASIVSARCFALVIINVSLLVVWWCGKVWGLSGVTVSVLVWWSG